MFPFSRKKKDQKEEDVPKWFMWLLGGFIIYAIISNLLTNKVAEFSGEEGQQAEEQATRIDFRGVMGKRSLPFTKEDVRVGIGPEVSCWNTVFVRYEMITPEGEVVEDNLEAEEPMRFTIGRGQVVPALERGVMGMRKDGQRQIAAQPGEAFGAPGFSHPQVSPEDFIGYTVKLEAVETPVNLPRSDFGLKIYDDRVGHGTMAQCTDTVHFRVNTWNLHGKTVWPEGAVEMRGRLGQGMLPYAVERGLTGIRVGGKRTLIVPPGYMLPIFDDADGDESPVETGEIDNAGAAEEPNDPQGVGEMEQPQQVTEGEVQTEPGEPQDLQPVAGESNSPWELLPDDEIIILELELLQRNVALKEENP